VSALGRVVAERAVAIQDCSGGARWQHVIQDDVGDLADGDYGDDFQRG
jgi:hypothetical protein